MAARRISSRVIVLRSRPNSKPAVWPADTFKGCHREPELAGPAFAETRASPLVDVNANYGSMGTTDGSTRYQRYLATPAVASSCKRWRLLIQLPVDPKPPLPRWVLSRDATSEICARTTGAITSWATRVPRVIATGALPKLASRTWISPR